QGNGIAVDGNGNAYVVGTTTSPNLTLRNPYQSQPPATQTVFVSAFDPSGTLLYATYIGGTAAGSSASGTAIALGSAGNAYLTGQATGNGFPTTPGAYQTSTSSTAGLGASADAFVAKLSAGGNSLIYSTLLGGSAADGGQGIALDGVGNVYVTGLTASPD